MKQQRSMTRAIITEAMIDWWCGAERERERERERSGSLIGLGIAIRAKAIMHSPYL